jgi:hypothetical protein
MYFAFRPAMRVIVALSASALLGACASGPDLRINADPDADFSQLNTFGFVQDLGTDNRGTRTMLSARLVTATTRELKSRGLQFVSNNPDVLIDFYSALQSGIDTLNQPILIMPVRNYGAWTGYRSPFGPGERITEGTLGVRVIDRRSNRLVWEGIAQDRVTGAMTENLDETVNSLIAIIFAKFPR